MKKTKSKKTARKDSAAKAAKKKTANPASKVALKGTVSKAKRKAELCHIPWSTVPVEELNPLLGRHFVVGQNIMLARVLLKKGCIVPEHSHPNEQIGMVTAGKLTFFIGDEEKTLGVGEFYFIPGGVRHGAEVPEDAVAIEVFSPVREDYLT